MAQLADALRHKAAGSIRGGVTGIFHCLNPSGCSLALRSTPPLTEMSTRDISWGVMAAVSRADNLTTLRACAGTAVPCTLPIIHRCVCSDSFKNQWLLYVPPGLTRPTFCPHSAFRCESQNMQQTIQKHFVCFIRCMFLDQHIQLHALCDTPLTTYVNFYMFRHRDSILRESL